MGVTVHGPPLYAIHTSFGLHGYRRFVVDCIATPVSGNTSERHSQTNGYATIGVFVPPEPLQVHYVGCT